MFRTPKQSRTEQIIEQLTRIADCLEEIVTVSRPNMDFTPASEDVQRVWYSDFNKEIIRERLAKLGKVPKDEK